MARSRENDHSMRLPDEIAPTPAHACNMATMLERTIAAPLLLVELARMSMNGYGALDWMRAGRSPAVKRKAIRMPKPRTPLINIANSMDCGTTKLLFATSSAIYTGV